jgi:tRNA(Arg) A34 adenosine deaminase TadA
MLAFTPQQPPKESAMKSAKQIELDATVEAAFAAYGDANRVLAAALKTASAEHAVTAHAEVAATLDAATASLKAYEKTTPRAKKGDVCALRW